MTEAAPPDDAERKPEGGDQPLPTAIELTAEGLGHDLLSALVDEFDRMPEHWPKMQKHQQEALIRRTETFVRKLVTDALGILLQGDHPNVKAVVESVQFKDGIKAVLKVARTEHSRFELAEHVGTPVVVILADPEQYFSRMQEIHSEKGQAQLPLGQPADEPDASAAAAPAPEGPHVFDDPEHTGTCTRCSKPAEEHPSPDADSDLDVERDAMWIQARALLADINVELTDDEAKALTSDQCTEAAYWVQLVKQQGKKAPPAPTFIKLPQGWKPPKASKS